MARCEVNYNDMDFFLSVEDFADRVEIKYSNIVRPTKLEAIFRRAEGNPNHTEAVEPETNKSKLWETDVYDLALAYVSHVLSRKNRYFINLCLKLKHFRGDHILTKPIGNMRSLRIKGIVDLHLIRKWHDSVTTRYLEKLHISLEPGMFLQGLGFLHMAQGAKIVVVSGGETDITDAQLDQFRCEEINVRSKFLTHEAIRSFVERNYERLRVQNKDIHFFCQFQPEQAVNEENAANYCMNALLPEDVQPSVVDCVVTIPNNGQ